MLNSQTKPAQFCFKLIITSCIVVGLCTIGCMHGGGKYTPHWGPGVVGGSAPVHSTLRKSSMHWVWKLVLHNAWGDHLCRDAALVGCHSWGLAVTCIRFAVVCWHCCSFFFWDPIVSGAQRSQIVRHANGRHNSSNLHCFCCWCWCTRKQKTPVLLGCWQDWMLIEKFDPPQDCHTTYSNWYSNNTTCPEKFGNSRLQKRT